MSVNINASNNTFDLLILAWHKWYFNLLYNLEQPKAGCF